MRRLESFKKVLNILKKKLNFFPSLTMKGNVDLLLFYQNAISDASQASSCNNFDELLKAF